MSTSQKTRSHGQSTKEPGNWTQMFPTKIKSQQASLLYVKKLLSVGVSTISYLRSMFPEEAYANKSLDGLKLKIIK